MSHPEFHLKMKEQSEWSDEEAASFEAALDLADRDDATADSLRAYLTENVSHSQILDHEFGPQANTEAKKIFSGHGTDSYPDFFEKLHSQLLADLRSELDDSEQAESRTA